MKRQGAELIVALTHLDSYSGPDGAISGAAAKLTLEAKGMAAVISGHSHKVVNGKSGGVPVVQVGFYGRAAGKIDLFYNKQAKRLIYAKIEIISLSNKELPADKSVGEIKKQVQTEIESVKNIILGKTIRALTHESSSG